jgi:putative DNA primase/helicase
MNTATARPNSFQGDLRNLPEALAPLKAIPHWVCWKWQWKEDKKGNGKWTKPPFQPRNPLQYAQNNNPSTWGTYEEALAAFETGQCDGIGFNLRYTKIPAFDLDKCRDIDTGTIAPEAMEIVDGAKSYTEMIVSGTGLRVIGVGDWSAIHCKQKIPGSSVEVESYSNTARYITISGNPLPGTCPHLADISQEIKAVVAKLGAPQQVDELEFERPTAAQPANPVASILKNLLPAQLFDLISSPPADCDLSEKFHHAVNWLGDYGYSAERIERLIAGKPIVPERYSKRLMKEIERCLSKAKPKQDANGVIAETQEIDNGAITQDGVARVFARRYAERLRFCHDTGKWYEWIGTHWQVDKKSLAFQFVRELAREYSEQSSKTEIKEVRKITFAGGVERFARSDRDIAVTSDYWDQDLLLLGTPAGTVDLQTGVLREADPADHITKVTSVGPAMTADCPRWRKFLDETTGNDAELIRFLQQWCGYALTGLTHEHALVFVYGPGGNGKSVFLNVITWILKGYAATSSMDTFTASKSDRHLTEIAKLCGARLVTASETEEGRAWAESRIKQLTGGDRISARFMRQDEFEFTPQLKLMIVGNHKPILRNIDDAARRRFFIVPFVRKPDQPDPELEQKLMNEAPGILRWMVEGCLDWQENRLSRPQSVVDATESYFENQDVLSQWIADECELDPGTSKNAPIGSLYTAWTAYCERCGETPGSNRAFGDALEKKGCSRGKVQHVRVMTGIRLKKGTSRSEAD